MYEPKKVYSINQQRFMNLGLWSDKICQAAINQHIYQPAIVKCRVNVIAFANSTGWIEMLLQLFIADIQINQISN